MAYFLANNGGILPITQGGTGASTVTGVLTNLGLPDSGWITLDEYSVVRYRKKNGIVFVVANSGEADSANGFLKITASSSAVMGTLPSEYRPTINMHAGGTQKEFGTDNALDLRVNTDGTVEIFNLSTSELGYYGACLMYPV